MPWCCLADAPLTTDPPTNLNLNAINKNPNYENPAITQTKTNKIQPIITWKCLFDEPTTSVSRPKQPQTNQKQARTFARALTNIGDVPSSQLPLPVLKGDNFAIEITNEEYIVGTETCKLNLHKRIIWPKGSTPLIAFDLRAKLSIMWKNMSKWSLTSLGKGFYEFSFSRLEDVKFCLYFFPTQ